MRVPRKPKLEDMTIFKKKRNLSKNVKDSESA